MVVSCFFLVGGGWGAMVENAGSSAAPAWSTRRVQNETRCLRMLCVGVNNGNCNMKRWRWEADETVQQLGLLFDLHRV